MKMSPPTFNVLRYFSTRKKAFLLFSSQGECPQPNALAHSRTSRHPSDVEMVRRGHPAIPDGVGDIRGGALLNPHTGRASQLPLVVLFRVQNSEHPLASWRC